jgi:predicted membrane channel-forming protein YqfA (hemolysin III family)
MGRIFSLLGMGVQTVFSFEDDLLSFTSFSIFFRGPLACFRGAQSHRRTEHTTHRASHIWTHFHFISSYITAISSYTSSYYGQVYSCIESSYMGIEFALFFSPPSRLV